MKRLITIGVSCAVVASLGAGSALAANGNSNGNTKPNPHKLASQQCAAQKQAMGNKAFKALYGKHAMRTCKRHQGAQATADIDNASQACSAEQADPNFATQHGGMTFVQFYGSNHNDKNAFGKCVSGKVSARLADEQTKLSNAAQTCRTQQADPSFATQHGGSTFAQFYGTNHNDRNAFGKCVSTTATA